MLRRYFLGITCSSLLAISSVQAQDKLYANEFPLGDVKLLDGPFKDAMDLNVTHLLKYTVDKLTSCYYTEAGLTPKAADYNTGGAWIGPPGLNGHVGGHYLSALAMQYAATGDAQCKERMDYMVSEFKKCQDANGKDADFVGYLSGVPNGKNFFRGVKSGNIPGNYWVPWYNIHKTYAGLRDAWIYGNNDTAKAMFIKLCDWGINICSSLNELKMQSMLGTEHGGINEMYADAYQITNETKYLEFAKKFSHKWLLDNMAKSSDVLDNNHANTQVPKAVGFARIAETGSDDYYHKAADFFWTTVTTKRSIAIGGNSRNEVFPSASSCIDFINQKEGVESCNTHNMLKLTEDLFRMKQDAKYIDFYERALFNHILSTQHPSHGGYVYFTPARPRHFRVYSAPDRDMWCCVGTGMENHTKYSQFIYTHQSDSLFVNLFIPSELDWKFRGVKIKQQTTFPDEERTVLTINSDRQNFFKLLIRHPSWVPSGKMKIIINKDTLSEESTPSSYVEIARTWNGGETVTVLLPMHFEIEQLINVPAWKAIKRGPIVLGAKISTNPRSTYVAGDGRWDHIPPEDNPPLDVNAAPKLTINGATFQSEFKPVEGKPFTYKAPGIFSNKADTNLVFEPFARIHDSRYMMYWNATVNGDIVSVDPQQVKKNNVAINEIRRTKGAITFSFANEDKSRHIRIYSLSGRKVADIAAYSPEVSFNYQNQNLQMAHGTYTVQIVSDKQMITRPLCIF
jgi:DUF1680 family protein